MTINPSGSYPTWIHNGLIDSLSTAVKVIADCEDVTTIPKCFGNAMAFCPGKYLIEAKTAQSSFANPFHLAKPFKQHQCTVPQYWGINFQPPDLGNSAPPFIGADMAIEVDSDGFCSTFTTIGSALAGKLLD